MYTEFWLPIAVSLLVIALIYALYCLECWLLKSLPEEMRYQRYCETELYKTMKASCEKPPASPCKDLDVTR